MGYEEKLEKGGERGKWARKCWNDVRRSKEGGDKWRG